MSQKATGNFGSIAASASTLPFQVILTASQSKVKNWLLKARVILHGQVESVAFRLYPGSQIAQVVFD
jgi:hypothetical protein